METTQVPQDVVDIEILLRGSLGYLGVVFVLGLIVNCPAALIYLRSRQVRGQTDKFILFIVLVDIISLLIFVPTSFVYVLEYSSSLHAELTDKKAQDGRPIFVGDETLVKKDDENGFEAHDNVFDSHCIQQWVFIIHKFIFIMATNLSILGPLKIAIERYLAVVAPLHYHKILESSLIFLVSLTSFIISLVFAVVGVADPTDFVNTFSGTQCRSTFLQRPWPAGHPGTRRAQSMSTLNEADDNVLLGDPGAILNSDLLPNNPPESLHSRPVAVWWPVLKLFHATVFFVLPVVLMLYMYLRIWMEARKQKTKMACNKSPFILPGGDAKKPGFNIEGLNQVFCKFKLVQRIKRKTHMNRAARVALITIGLPVLCFGPLFYVQIVSAAASLMNYGTERLPEGSFDKFKYLIPTLIACLHPVLSPLVYVCRYKKVREELRILLKDMISGFNCCSRTDAPSANDNCQEYVQQFNHLAHKLPLPPSDYQQVLESQNVLRSDSDTAITINKNSGNEMNEDGIESENGDSINFTAKSILQGVFSDDEEQGRQECSEFSDIESPEYRDQQAISKANNAFLNFINGWMSSYSRRWHQHRESVTSTASFITLLSNRRSIPQDDN